MTENPDFVSRMDLLNHLDKRREDIARVSLETGNSPRKIMESYSCLRNSDGKLITPELAARWFSIRPPEGLLEASPATPVENRDYVAA